MPNAEILHAPVAVMDQLIKVAAGLPMANYLVFDSVTPLREYESFGQDIDNRLAALG